MIKERNNGTSIKSPLSKLSEKLAFIPNEDSEYFDISVDGVVKWCADNRDLSQSSYTLWDFYRRIKNASSPEALFTLTAILTHLKPGNEVFAREHAKNARLAGKTSLASKIFDYWNDVELGASPLSLDHATYLLDVGDWKQTIDLLEPDTHRYSGNSRFNYLLGQAYVLSGRLDDAIDCFQKATSGMSPEIRSYLRLAEVYTQTGALRKAIDVLQKARSLKPNDAEIRMRLTRAFVQNKDYEKASMEVSALSQVGLPSPQKERFISDTRKVIDMEVVRKRRIAVITDTSAGNIAEDIGKYSAVGTVQVFQDRETFPDASKEQSSSSPLEKIVSGKQDFDLVLICQEDFNGIFSQDVFSHSFSRAAWIEISDDKGVLSYLISYEFLCLFSSAMKSENLVLSANDLLRAIRDHKTYINHLTYGDAGLSIATDRGLNDVNVAGKAWLVSNSGIKVFGGVERFLRGMYKVYSAFDCNPIIIGLSSENAGESGVAEGFGYQNISREPNEIFRELLTQKPAVLHTTTGAGYEALHSAKYFKCNILYGTHFWRDMFEGRDWFKDVDFHQVIKPYYESLITLTDMHYCNSLYTQELTFNHFNHVFRKIFSVPDDVDAEDVGTHAKKPAGLDNYVLLLNSRLEKGFDILLEVASELPDIQFLAVANQSAITISREQVEKAGLKNVTVLPFVADTSVLYKNAHVVIVPSYEFVETFSRVVIEAHRYGKPVIGSDRGNVPLLLRQSGVFLPKERDLWVEEIGHLYSSEKYYAERSTLAAENSNRYQFDAQYGKIKSFLDFSKTRVAVAVGSGIGNVVQTLPAVNLISKHYGAPVDILLSSDFDQASAVFKDQPSVNSTFVYNKYSKERWYETLIVLDCFGRMPPTNLAREVINLRDYVDFTLSKSMPEAEFYLYGYKIATGVDYTPSDVKDLDMRVGYSPRKEANVIGIHGGSKGGAYLAKQWAGFEELTSRLKAKGFEVRSFGSKSEYVTGTINCTGTSLWESINNIAKCEMFISNDSGLMHVADALHVPLISLFAPTSALKNGPLSPNATVIGIPDSCSPCQFNKDKFLNCKCIGKISIDRVEEVVLSRILVGQS